MTDEDSSDDGEEQKQSSGTDGHKTSIEASLGMFTLKMEDHGDSSFEEVREGFEESWEARVEEVREGEATVKRELEQKGSVSLFGG